MKKEKKEVEDNNNNKEEQEEEENEDWFLLAEDMSTSNVQLRWEPDPFGIKVYVNTSDHIVCIACVQSFWYWRALHMCRFKDYELIFSHFLTLIKQLVGSICIILESTYTVQRR